MRFTLRPGTDPDAEADRILLRALGLASGGIIRVGATHVRVRPGDVSGADLRIGPRSLANAGLAVGASIEVTRVLPGPATRIAVEPAPRPAKELLTALHGRLVTTGDRILVPMPDGTDVEATVTRVEPGDVGIVGPETALGDGGPSHPTEGTAHTPSAAERTSAALLAGLDTELEVVTGWFSLLASDQGLERRWSLPSVAGIVVEGPIGCGRSELVAEAAKRAGATVHEVDTSLVFTAEKLLDLLSGALDAVHAPAIVFVDRVEAVIGGKAITTFRSQSLAVMRWFLERVAERSGVMCVIGTERVTDLDDAVATSPLLPRVVTIPPPDLRRRELLFEAALADVPTSELDASRLAARSAGFSGADIVSAVLHAAARAAAGPGTVDTDAMVAAIAETPPSLGGVPLGEATSFGFEAVANLDDVKARLVETVVWPMRDPDRFARLGIEPPRGILLYGPPGTGKTFVVKALAHEAGAAFFSVKGAELLDKYVGESERGVRDVFARARAAAPSIIFFDEFDALAPVRGSSTNSVTDSVVAALLTEIDGVGDAGALSVIAATNRRDLIDPALLRAGRFETHILLDLPVEASRRALLGITDVPLSPTVDLDELARRTEGFSFADLTGMLREAALTALRVDEGALVVEPVHVDAAYETVRTRLGLDPATS